jgi:hypothetical protein
MFLSEERPSFLAEFKTPQMLVTSFAASLTVVGPPLFFVRL